MCGATMTDVLESTVTDVRWGSVWCNNCGVLWWHVFALTDGGCRPRARWSVV